MSVTELPIGQHVAAIAAGQIDAAYTLEPTGTIGRLNGTTRVLEAGVVAHYILGDPMAPWHGGSASLTTEFIKKYPAETKKFIAAYARGIELVRSKPDEARQFMKGYTAIEGALTAEVPLASYMLYNEFKASDVAYFQKFYDLFSDKGIFEKRVDRRADALQGLSHGRRHHHRRRALERAERCRQGGAEALRLEAPAAGRRAADPVHRLGPRRARSASSSRSCCRRRRRRSARSFTGLAGGPLLTDFAVTVLRTLEAFLIAAVVGVPLGVAARQQREGVPQRRVPDRLLPLDAVVGADPAVPADLRRLRHQQGRDRGLRRAPDRRLQQRLRRHQRAQAARDGGARDGRVALAGVQGRADLGEPAADLRRPALGGVDGARDRHRRRDVHRLRQRPRPPHHRRAAGAEREEHVRGDPRRRRARLRAQRAVPRRRDGRSSTGAEDERRAQRPGRRRRPGAAASSPARPARTSRSAA